MKCLILAGNFSTLYKEIKNTGQPISHPLAPNLNGIQPAQNVVPANEHLLSPGPRRGNVTAEEE